MKVLFDGLCMNGNLSGVQYYAWHLLREALHGDPNKISLHTLCSTPQSAFPKSTLIQLRIPNRIARIGYQHGVLPGRFRREGYDLLHCPAYILPWRFRGRSVITVHDLIAVDFPASCKNSNALYFRLALRRSIQRCGHIIAVSEQVKNDIMRLCGVGPDKITTIHHGIDPLFTPLEDDVCKNIIRRKYNLPDRYLLFVGNIEPKKNLSRLIRAYYVWQKRTGLPHRLVIAGQLAWKYEDVLTTVRELNLFDRVQFLNYVVREDLPALYSMAELFVFPSLYEGFGFPPLEAMACGTAVLTSREGALPEITGGHCFYADAYSVEDMAVRMEEALSDSARRTSQRTAGMCHAGRFTWQKTWKHTLDVYQSLI